MTNTPDNDLQPTRRGGRRLQWAVGGALLLAIAIQLVPYGVDNPSARDEPTWDSARTKELFMTACGDCHSNQTKILWFEHAAPIKWYVANHVEEGRHALNVDTWHTAAGEGADEWVKVIRKGSMPPDFYTYFGLHSDSKLSAAEKQELIDGLTRTAQADPPKR